MATTPTLKALGLEISTNPLELPAGSMTEASDVIIKRNDIVESRRGYRVYDAGFGDDESRAKQLAVYKQRILTHYSNTLAFDSGEVDESGLAIFSNFAGSITEAQTGLRTKSIEANGNFYFTSSEGIKKISAASAEDFTTSTGYITPAGGIKAVDFVAEPQYDAGNQTGFMDVDSAVAYRVVWGTKDANNNLILGAPSQRAEVFNSLLTTLNQDFIKVLGALDSINVSGSLINDGTYISSYSPFDLSSSAVELRTDLLSLVNKIDEDILYANDTGTGAPLTISSAVIAAGVCTITFSAGTATDYFTGGSDIFLTGFVATTGSINGAQTVSTATGTTITFSTSATGPVTVVGAYIVSNTYRSITQPGTPSTPATNTQLVALQTYLSEIITALQAENSNVIPTTEANEFIVPLDVTSASSVKLTITIPEDVDANYFVQIYRTAVAPATGTSVLATDVAPGDEMQQVYEAYPTAAELATLEMIVVDNTPDTFRGANLYTNAQSGEGILQANDTPPFAKDINNFKNVTFYSNTRVKHKKILNLLGVSNMLADYDLGTTPKLTITNADGSFNTYSFVRGAYETTSITTVADVTDSLDGKYFYINSANNSTEYYVWFKTVAGVDPAITGKTGIKVQLATGDTAITVATKTANKLSEYPLDFSVSRVGAVVTITNTEVGYTENAVDVNTGFTIAAPSVQGVGERATQQVTQVNTVADVAGSLAGTYFLISSAFDQTQYYVWYKVSGVGSDPAIANKIGIRVDIVTNDSAAAVSTATVTKLNEFADFAAELDSPNFVVANSSYGPTTASSAGTSGFILSTTQTGALDVLLSDSVSTAQSVDETARSLVRIINKNRSEGVYAYYISGAADVPGKLYIEARALNTPAFYVLANNENTGLSFNPDLSPTLTISSITTGNPSTMLVTTSTPHGLSNLDTVIITATDSDASIDGYHQITYVSATQFRVEEYITVAGTIGALIPTADAVVTENDDKPNRVYYSKLNQPEAVPQVNYFDVGAKDKAILRIFPLRDTLFVLKEDGLFRISGEVAPFTLALFDSSCILVAPDSVSVANNTVYAWTTQGISTITESGVQTISRPIDTDVLRVSSARYTGFKTATWGIGYDSDNSYIVYTVSNPSDTVAIKAYRYSNITNTWTTFAQSKTCGIVNPVDDKVYLGCSDLNNIEQERKDFTRTDYADREYTHNLTAGNYFQTQLKLLSVVDISVGDVITQEQTVSNYTFNMLLKKLDLDPGNADHDYESTLEATAGNNIRSKLEALATKLDADANIVSTSFSSSIATKSGVATAVSAADPCVITSTSHGLLTGRVVQISSSNSSPTVDGARMVTVIDANTFSVDVSVITPGTTATWVTVNNDFRDVKACYNKVIDLLNADAGPAFANYSQVDDSTTLEAIVTAVNTTTKYITLNLGLPFQVGELRSYESIMSKFTYAPIHMEDPVTFKHFRELTIMFLSKAFTSAKVRVASDLLPQLLEIPFNGDGNGIFGYSTFGEGFFGGASHPVPFRTYVPRPCQRARYLVIQFEHAIAREQYGVTGMSVAGEPYSIRAYR